MLIYCASLHFFFVFLADSEVMQEVFGPEAGVGVRSAVGMILPKSIATEVECVFELHDDAPKLL